jgi:hypothetical protein
MTVRVDFNKDGQEDILFRYQGAGGLQGTNCIWLMNQTGALTAIPMGIAQIRGGITGMQTALAPGLTYRTPMDAGTLQIPDAIRSSQSPLSARDLRIHTRSTAKWSPMGTDGISTRPAKNAHRKATVPSVLTTRSTGTGSVAGDGLAGIASASIVGYLYPPTILDLGWEIVGAGDFNGDGNTDILWRNYDAGAYSGWNCIWYMKGATIIGYGYPEIVTDLDWRIEATADFDGDGHLDILWRNYGSGTFSGWNCIWYMNGQAITGYGHGAVGIIGYGYPEIVWDLDWKITGVGDFNGDGHADILWRNYGSGTYGGSNCIWYMDGQRLYRYYGHQEEGITGFAYPEAISDLWWQIVGTGDFNKDGYADILWRYYGPGEFQGWNCIWYMQGASIIGYDYPSTIPDTNWRITNR